VVEDDDSPWNEIGNDGAKRCSGSAVVVGIDKCKKNGLAIKPPRCRFKDVPNDELNLVWLGVRANCL